MVTNEAELTAVLRLRDETAGQWKQFNENASNAGQRLREMSRNANLAAATVTGLVFGLSRAQLATERAAIELKAQMEGWSADRLRRELESVRDPVRELGAAFGSLAASLQVNQALSQMAGALKGVSDTLARLDPRLLAAIGQSIVFIAGALTALATALLLVRLATSPLLGIAAIGGFAALVAAQKFGTAQTAGAGVVPSGSLTQGLKGSTVLGEAARGTVGAQGGTVVTNNILNVPESSLIVVEDNTAFSRMNRSIERNLVTSARLGTVP